MLNLLEQWESNLLPKWQDEYPKAAAAPANARMFPQANFVFKKPPQVIFVRDIKGFVPLTATRYKDLPKIRLTPEEQKVVQAKHDEIFKRKADQKLKQDELLESRIAIVNKKRSGNLTPEEHSAITQQEEAIKAEEKKNENPLVAHSYDGNIFFITNVVYDSQKNILYLVPAQTTYSFLLALRSKAFPESSELYKRNYYPFGEWAPLITKDNHTFVLKRFDGLFSATGGFFEASGGIHSKPFAPKGFPDFPAYTAAAESVEELLGVDGEAHTMRCNITQFHGLQSLTFSRSTPLPGGGSVGFLEFIYPLHLNARKDEMIEIIENNSAEHCWEHPRKTDDKHTYVMASLDFDSLEDIPVPLTNNFQAELFARMFDPKTLRTNPGSNFWVHPLMLSASLAASPGKFSVPRKLPHSRVTIVDLDAVVSSTTKMPSQISHFREQKSTPKYSYASMRFRLHRPEKIDAKIQPAPPIMQPRNKVDGEGRTTMSSSHFASSHMLRVLTPPKNPKEAIESRRNPCYGFTIIADLQEHTELIATLTMTRDSILKIIDPQRESKLRPIRSPLYIKQKFFHASVFSMAPLLGSAQFVKIYANANGLLNRETMDNMCSVIQTHLKESQPKLQFVKCEIMQDGAILARFAYKTKVNDDAPLLTLASQLDPQKKFSKWGPENRLRYSTVAVLICVVDRDKISDKLSAINELLYKAAESFNKLGPIDIERFQFISSYDKRTLSLQHFSMYGYIEADHVCKI